MKKMRESMALRNYGFKKVERLGSGGVGLLELEASCRPIWSATPRPRR